MNKFYVSDSFTLQIIPPTTTHFPGPANSSQIYGPGQRVSVLWTAGELGLVVYQDAMQGANVDITLTLYDVTPGNPAPGWSVVGQGDPIPFVAPFGTAPNGVLLDVTCRYGAYARSSRYPVDPICLGMYTPGDADRQYQIGARFDFHCGAPATAAYQYYLAGKVG